LAGFFGKFYLFSVALRADRGLLWLVIVALFGSFVSLYYYLIVLKFVFVEKSREARPSLAPPHFVTNATIAILAGAILFFGLLPQTLAARILNSLP
jgi:NADH-quinone oxidoreductase subunit N